MNKLITIAVLLLLSTLGYGQVGLQTVPSVEIKSIDGKPINSKDFNNNGKPIVINFWATWCKPCVRELTNIAEVYDQWVEETGVKIIAVSIDDARSMARVAPFVNGKGWEYEVVIDPNSDLKRAMNVPNVPHTFLIDGKGKVVWQHVGYADGDEFKLYDLIKKVAKGEAIK